MRTIAFDDLAALEAFWDARVAPRPLDRSPRGLAAYREAILEWLVRAGMSQAGLDPTLCHEALAGREPVRVFVWLEDSSRAAHVLAIPEAALTPAQRAALDAGVAGELELAALRSGLDSTALARADLDAPILACHTLRAAR